MPETSLDLNTQSLASLVVREPVANNEVATKAFVESHGGTNFLPLSGGTMTGVLNMNNNNLMMRNTLSGDSNSILWKTTGAAADFNEIKTIGNGNLVLLSATGAFFAIAGGQCYTNRPLNMNSNNIINVLAGTSGFHAVNLNQLNLKLNNTGGTLSGNLTFSGDNQIINPSAITLRNAGKIMAIQNGTFFQPFSDSTSNNARIIAFTERDNDTQRTLTLDLYTKLTTFGGQIDMANNQIYNLMNGSSPSSAVNKSQLDVKFNTDGSIPMSGNLTVNRTGSNGVKTPLNIIDTTGGLSPSLNYTYNNVNETGNYSNLNINSVRQYGGGCNLYMNNTEGSFFNIKSFFSDVNQYRTLLRHRSEIQDQDISITMRDNIIQFQNELQMSGNKISNITDPTNPQDCATKKYVDDSIPASNANTPIATMYSTVRFEMNSFTWQACKFLIPSNIQSGRFLFNADISIWDSDNALSPENITSNKCYIDYRICDNAGNPLETYQGKRIEDFCFNNGSLIVPKPMNKTNTEFYYSNATTSINYEIPLTTASQFNEIQFQCRWSQFIIYPNNNISPRTPADGFTDMRVILTILPTV
jgi:hypothetical protein